jgi:hypothetical protein
VRIHHTKNKGDIGLVHAIADLTDKGWGVLLPVTEHEAFDLVAYRRDLFVRVQAKYRAMTNGCVAVPFVTCWADRNGVHRLAMDKNVVDLICVYCPDTKQCYYIDPTRYGSGVQLRIEEPRNGQGKYVHRATEFTDPLAQLDKSNSLLRNGPQVRVLQGSRKHRAREAVHHGWPWLRSGTSRTLSSR